MLIQTGHQACSKRVLVYSGDCKVAAERNRTEERNDARVYIASLLYPVFMLCRSDNEADDNNDDAATHKKYAKDCAKKIEVQ